MNKWHCTGNTDDYLRILLILADWFFVWGASPIRHYKEVPDKSAVTWPPSRPTLYRWDLELHSHFLFVLMEVLLQIAKLVMNCWYYIWFWTVGQWKVNWVQLYHWCKLKTHLQKILLLWGRSGKIMWFSLEEALL